LETGRNSTRPCVSSAFPARLFLAVLFVVLFHRLFSVTSRMDYMRSRYMSMVRRFLMMPGLVVLGRFTMMTGSVGKMFLYLLVVFGRFLRHCRFLPVLFAAKTPTATWSSGSASRAQMRRRTLLSLSWG
jgi:hypothetical protein